MMDHELGLMNATFLRRSDPGFERALFRACEGDALLDRASVLETVNACPDDTLFASLQQGIYVQIGQPFTETFERFLLRYDGSREPIYMIHDPQDAISNRGTDNG